MNVVNEVLKEAQVVEMGVLVVDNKNVAILETIDQAMTFIDNYSEENEAIVVIKGPKETILRKGNEVLLKDALLSYKITSDDQSAVMIPALVREYSVIERNKTMEVRDALIRLCM